MKFIHFFIISLLITSCIEKDPPRTALELLSKTIQVSSSGNDFRNTTVNFSREDLDYEFYRKNNITDYKVTRKIDTMLYKATYSNGHIEYLVNDSVQPETSHSRIFIKLKLEAIAHLMSIPYVFDENSVISKRLDNAVIKDKEYFSINIKFKDIDGAKVKDEFILYIDPQTYYIDYISEYFDLSRNRLLFRKAINTRFSNGFKISDYHVFYTNTIENYGISNFYKLFNENKLLKQNDVIFKNVEIKMNTD